MVVNFLEINCDFLPFLLNKVKHPEVFESYDHLRALISFVLSIATENE